MPPRRVLEGQRYEPPVKCMKSDETHLVAQCSTIPMVEVPASPVVDNVDTLPKEASMCDKVIQVRTMQIQTTEESLNLKVSKAQKMNNFYNEEASKLEGKIKDMELKLSESLLKLNYYKENRHHQGVQQMLKENSNDSSSATFILDQLKNYKQETPNWSPHTLKMCGTWLASHPKSYSFASNHIMTLPNESSLAASLHDVIKSIDTKDSNESSSVPPSNDSASQSHVLLPLSSKEKEGSGETKSCVLLPPAIIGELESCVLPLSFIETEDR